MRFGKSAAEAAEEPNRATGGDFIRYLKEGDTTFRILEDDWTYYWEHFSPAGFSFPCPNEDGHHPELCPGCSSDNEKMKKVNRRIAFNVLQSTNGTEYVNVYKVGPTVADKLDNRKKRAGTVTDRDYTISKYKTSGDRWDFDVDGHDQSPIDVSQYDLKDIEAMLQQAWDDAWGDGQQAQANRQALPPTPPNTAPARPRVTIAPAPKPVAQEEPPFEEPVFQEADLRKMPLEDLLILIKNNLQVNPPDGLLSSDDAVDWLMSIQP